MNSMLDKLAGIEERYEELTRQLMEVGNDYQKAAELNKERTDIEAIVEKAREYREALKRLEEARALRRNRTGRRNARTGRNGSGRT